MYSGGVRRTAKRLYDDSHRNPFSYIRVIYLDHLQKNMVQNTGGGYIAICAGAPVGHRRRISGKYYYIQKLPYHQSIFFVAIRLVSVFGVSVMSMGTDLRIGEIYKESFSGCL